MINLTWKISLQETALHQGQQAQIWNLQREHCEERGGGSQIDVRQEWKKCVESFIIKNTNFWC